MNRDKALHGVALAVLALGVALTVQSIRTTPQKVRQFKRKAADLVHLADLQRGRLRDQAAMGMFEKLSSKKPVSIAELAKSYASLRPDIRLREAKPAAGDWVVRSADVTCEGAKLSDAALLILTLENQRPPWKLIECGITAGDQGAGYGRASLVFEALEKKSQ